MIERIGSEYTVSCDNDHCSWEEYFDTDEWDFLDVVEEIKGDGWRISKKKGEWWHVCPDCVESARGRRGRRR